MRKVFGWMSVLPLLALAPQARADLITDGNFASVSPTLRTNGICTTDPAVYPYGACTAAGWTGNYQIGNGRTVGIFGVSFGIPQPDPNGSTNALILQSATHLAPTATQSITLPTAGLYTLSFYVANRSTPAGNNGPQTVSVLLDNAAIAGGIYHNLPDAWTLETLDFSASAGNHTLTLEGLTTSSSAVSAHVTAFVDDVSLLPETVSVSTPEPSSCALLGLALIVLATATRKRFAR